METRNPNEQAASRRGRRPLEKPETYGPASYNYPERSVKPIEIDRSKIEIPARSTGGIVGLGCLVGLASGIILIVQNSKSNILYSVGSGGVVVAHCLIWGVILGALLGLCLSPLYKKQQYIAPVLAPLLFLPTILYLLSTPLTMINMAVVAVVKFLIGLAVVVVLGFVAKAFFCD